MHRETVPTAAVRHELIMAGFGGQGVLRMGQTLAEAAVLEGREVVWTPAYGPEMRGGPAFCTVIVSSSPIGSPVVSLADTAIIMDQPSLAKYQHGLRPHGRVLFNSSLINSDRLTSGVRGYPIPANHLAEEIGDARIANMVMLGAFLRLTELVRPQSILDALSGTLPERHRHLLPLNERALSAGADALTA